MPNPVQNPPPRVLLVADPLRRAGLALQLTRAGACVVRADSPEGLTTQLASGDFVGLVVDVAERAEDDVLRLDWSEAEALRETLACAHGWPLVARATSADAAAWVHSLRSTGDTTCCVPGIDADVVAWLTRARSPHPRLVGGSSAMRSVLADLDGAAGAGRSVLITGEPGVGKLLVARTLVERIGGSAVLVECARWSPSARFDPDRVVGNLRRTGVVVLERLDALPAEHTRAFAGWIDRLVERQAARSMRLITTCDVGPDRAPLIERIGARTYFRLDSSRIEVPPLRARTEDIPLLLVELARRRGAALQLTSSERATLARVRYEWPGNVQELRGVLSRALEGTSVQGAALVQRFVAHIVSASGPDLWGRSLRFTRHVRERELVRALAVATLDAVGDVRLTADLLGCHEATVRAAMRVRFDPTSGSIREMDAARRAARDPGHLAPPA